MGDLLGSPRVHQCTGFHQNSVVKRAWARVVLGWVTSREVLVLHLSLQDLLGDLLGSAVKRALARVVLVWVTSWEVLVLHSFYNN